ncbi:protein CREG1 [Drosophila sulfurigaster albostrigata]|uniref:Protein CREG1 n=1 Tax=Drosophila albomicans TaxID=7291 RepID=A0A6P8XTB1_DROAB|nr:protein CREG1 [Drosophila albomicans]XP_062125998.1 protein CREG1 [Drosophila sulfurigaster albostrigata]
MLLPSVITILLVSYTQAYSALQDAQVIAEFKRESELNHTKIVRELVHRANWASVGTISTNGYVKDYPMVNIISIDDNNEQKVSTGVIRFLLTDLDFTGNDWQSNNKVTFMFTDEQTLNCKSYNKDPMEPTCARAMLSGQVTKMDKDSPKYNSSLRVFIDRHPAAEKWITRHQFYLCELDIQNIFVLDFYGGPHQVNVSDYYAINI